MLSLSTTWSLWEISFAEFDNCQRSIVSRRGGGTFFGRNSSVVIWLALWGPLLLGFELNWDLLDW